MYCKNCGTEFKNENKFCTNCGYDRGNQYKGHSPNKIVEKEKFNQKITDVGKWKAIAIIIGFIAVIFILALLFSNRTNISSITNIGNAQSVVNIVCDDGSGGSGTIFTAEGMVITNNHVVADATSCLVTIPDVATGQAVEIYKGEPSIVSVLSEKYDIAGVQITDPYTDSDGKTWGTYSKTFSPFVLPDTCDTKKPSQLGDQVKIYGYPVTSGGYNLTVTDGIISSFADDGNILTSAQIDSGNSGGLAIDQDGCWLGIPSAVVSGDYQNLGVIIPSYTVVEFADAVLSEPEITTTNPNTITTPKKTSNQICKDTYGTYSEWNGQKNSGGTPLCTCKAGYSWDATGDTCALQSILNQECKDRFGPGGYSLYENGKAVCGCITGYELSSGNVCVKKEATCANGSFLYEGMTTCMTPLAYCQYKNGAGSVYNSVDNTCSTPTVMTNDQKCAQKYNNSYAITKSDGSYSCNCKYGYYWDNNAVDQDGNCFTKTELNQACYNNYSGGYWDGTYGPDGLYSCRLSSSSSTPDNKTIGEDYYTINRTCIGLSGAQYDACITYAWNH